MRKSSLKLILYLKNNSPYPKLLSTHTHISNPLNLSLFISFPISSIQHGLKFSRFLAFLTNFQRNFVVLKLDIWTICACANWHSFSTTRNLLTTFDLGKSASFISSISWDGMKLTFSTGVFLWHMNLLNDIFWSKNDKTVTRPGFSSFYHNLFPAICLQKNSSSYNLHSKSDFVIPQVSTILKESNSIRYYGPVIWSLRPEEIKIYRFPRKI